MVDETPNQYGAHHQTEENGDFAVERPGAGHSSAEENGSRVQQGKTQLEAGSTPTDSSRLQQVKMLFVVMFGAIATFQILTPLWQWITFARVMSAEELLYTVPSPDGTYSLHVHYTPAFGFGAHDIILRAKEQRKTLTKHHTTLGNDGMYLYESNVQIQWQSDTLAHICLQGEEQRPTGMILQLTPQEDGMPRTSATFTEAAEGCS